MSIKEGEVEKKEEQKSREKNKRRGRSNNHSIRRGRKGTIKTTLTITRT